MAYTPFPIAPGAGSGGGGGSSGLSNANPADLGTAAPGVATEASRADHVHDLPTAADVGAAAASHSHSGSDITSGTVAFDRLPTGTSGTTVAVGNDSRFTDTRTPTDGTVTAAKFATNVLDTDLTMAADSDSRVPSQKAVKAHVAAAKGGALGYVAHGATAGTARPAGYAAVVWVGTVEPDNWVAGDIWEDPS